MSTTASAPSARSWSRWPAAPSVYTTIGRVRPAARIRRISSSPARGSLRSVAGHDFRYFCPSSVFSLPELDLYLEQTTGPDERGDIDLVAFAATPVVFLMPPEVYAAAVQADDRIGWGALLA